MFWRTPVKMSYRKLQKLLAYHRYKHTFLVKKKTCYKKKLVNNICPTCSTNYTGETEITSAVCNVLINQEEEYRELTLFTSQVEEITQKSLSPKRRQLKTIYYQLFQSGLNMFQVQKRTILCLNWKDIKLLAFLKFKTLFRYFIF